MKRFWFIASLCILICSCSKKLEIEYLPVELDDDGRVTLMAPDGSTVDYDFKGFVSPVVNGYFTVNGRKGYEVYRFDKKNAELVSDLEKLSWAGEMSDGLIPIRRKDNGKIEFVDGSGDSKFSLQRNVNCVSSYFTDGMILVSKTDSNDFSTKFGAVNTSGELTVKIKYDDINFFNEGCAPVKSGDKWMLIDKDGEKICDLKGVESIQGSMLGGKVLAMKNSRWGLCDRDGEFTRFNNDITPHQFNGKYIIASDPEGSSFGVYNTEGEEIIKPRYDAMQFYGDDRFICQRDEDRFDIIDTKGNVKFTLNCETVITFNGTSPWFNGDFLIAGDYGRLFLYDNDGDKIPDSKFHKLF